MTVSKLFWVNQDLSISIPGWRCLRGKCKKWMLSRFLCFITCPTSCLSAKPSLAIQKRRTLPWQNLKPATHRYPHPLRCFPHRKDCGRKHLARFWKKDLSGGLASLRSRGLFENDMPMANLGPKMGLGCYCFGTGVHPIGTFRSWAMASPRLVTIHIAPGWFSRKVNHFKKSQTHFCIKFDHLGPIYISWRMQFAIMLAQDH